MTEARRLVWLLNWRSFAKSRSVGQEDARSRRATRDRRSCQRRGRMSHRSASSAAISQPTPAISIFPGINFHPCDCCWASTSAHSASGNHQRLTAALGRRCLGPELISIPRHCRRDRSCRRAQARTTIACGVAEVSVFVCCCDEYSPSLSINTTAAVRWPCAVNGSLMRTPSPWSLRISAVHLAQRFRKSKHLERSLVVPACPSQRFRHRRSSPPRRVVLAAWICPRPVRLRGRRCNRICILAISPASPQRSASCGQSLG